MGIFSRVRRQSAARPSPLRRLAAGGRARRGGADARRARPAPAPEPAVATLGTTASRGGTAGLSPATVPATLRHPPVARCLRRKRRSIARATNTKAAALLTYEQRAAACSCRTSASRATRNSAQRRCDGQRVGHPLRSIRNRRINVIESAHENPSCQAAGGDQPAPPTIAAVPFFHANADRRRRAVLPTPRVRRRSPQDAEPVAAGVRPGAERAAAVRGRARASSRKRPPPSRPSRGLAALKSELARLTQASTNPSASAPPRPPNASPPSPSSRRPGRAGLEHELAELRTAQEQVPAIEEGPQPEPPSGAASEPPTRRSPRSPSSASSSPRPSSAPPRRMRR